MKSRAKIILITLLATCFVYWPDPGSMEVVAEQLEDGSVRFPKKSENGREKEDATGVQVTTDKMSYRSGEQIFVTLHNELPTAIYAPPVGPAYCSLVSVQKLEAGQWITQDGCEPGDSVSNINLDPSSGMIGILCPAPRHTGIQGPFWGRPSNSRIVEGDLRDLPTVEPPIPGTPLREVPQAIRPMKKDVFSAIKGVLRPGTYRLAFSFMIGLRSSQVETVYSQLLLVNG